MSYFSDNKDYWYSIIENITIATNRNFQMVEKDLIQSKFLYELSKSDLPFVFKGGTSLSKAYQVIDRYSEDIDLSMTRHITDSEKKKVKNIILDIAESLDFELSNPDKIRSRYHYNKYEFYYDSFFSNNKIQIIIETYFYQTAFPIAKHKINSYVGNYLEKNNIKLDYDFLDFSMNVQTLERTFIDKVFAICDYRIEDMEKRDSRHLYDICKMFPLITFDDNFKKLILEVRNDRVKFRHNHTEKLIYENAKYEDVINNGIAKLIPLRLF